MSIITIRLNDEEEKTFNEYAKLYDIPLSTLFKETLEERIENEIYIKIIKEYENDVKDGSFEIYSSDKAKEMLRL